MCRIRILITLGPLLLLAAAMAVADDVDRQVAVIAGVGPLGVGSTAAEQACNQLSGQASTTLPRLLKAMDTPNIVAANWYRSAYERIVARELAKPHPAFPVAEFEMYVREPAHQGRARRLALALLDRVDPAFKKALLPTLVDDPEFRDDALAIALKQADDAQSRGDNKSAKRDFETVFQHGRDVDQVSRAAARLEAIGKKVSIAEHFGFVRDWFLMGPFPAPAMTGFRTSFPPEHAVDLGSTLTNSQNKTLHWLRHRTTNPFGTVDLAQALGPADEAVAYAYSEIESPAARAAELRCSADDNLTVWINGQQVFSREMWLNGTRLDRFITPVRLASGRNRLLVKICQSPHHRDPSVGNAWTFQLRFCSPDGAGIAMKSLLPSEMRTSARPSKEVR